MRRDRHEEQVVGERYVDADAAAKQVGLHDAQHLHGDRQDRHACECASMSSVQADGVGEAHQSLPGR